MMNYKVLSVIFLIFLFSFVAADILSINSGGDRGLIINPQQYIEGFFFSANNLPVLSSLILSSSLGTNTTNENLSITYTSVDSDGDALTNITDWRLDGNSIARLNLPFDTRRVTGEVRDYSTYQNNGTLGGGNTNNVPTWELSCQVGGCYDFDGSNDYIDTPYGQGINPTSNPHTFSMWVKSDSPNSNQIFFSSGQVPVNSNRMYLAIYGGKWDLGIQGSSWSGGVTDTDSNWNFITLIMNGTNANLYINGVYSLQRAYTSYTFNQNFDIGRHADGNYQFNGSIDEVRVYSRALSLEEVVLLYNEGLAGRHPETLVSQETSTGDVWQVAATPNDVYSDGATVLSNNLTIVNDAPEDPTQMSLVSVDSSNESDQDLNCSAFISDADNENLEVNVNWLKEGVSQFNLTFSSETNGTIFSSILDSGNLTLFDNWTCSVRTYDNTDYSNWVDSNDLKIIDITDPLVYIVSPNSTHDYTTLQVDFNVSITENENMSICQYSLDGLPNVTMVEVNDSYFWHEPNLGPGPHEVNFSCNDTSNNWGYNSTTFEILNEAAISIDLSDALSWNVNWTIITLPADDLDATGNNFNDSTDYFVNVSAENTNVDLYVRADGDLLTAGLDAIGLGNETYSFSTNDSTVSNISKVTMTTNYSLIGENLPDLSAVYLKFYLDAPVGQAAGTYLNNLEFKAVRYGQSV